MQEPQYDEDEDTSPTLASGVKLLLMVASLAVASIVGFYLHPHLPPLFTESLPQLWRTAQGWLTAPVLFLLLNVVVGTLYFSSSMLCSSNMPRHSDHRSRPTNEAPLTKGSAVPLDPTSPPPPPVVASVAEERKPPSSRPSTGLRARFEKSRTLSRLVRSKSDQIPPVTIKATAELASGSAAVGGRLKKAGTFEQPGRLARKPVVVVADPPEDATAPQGHEEVDQKAEAFISRFYHKVKLQRLDSLLRQQQQAGAGN